MSTWLAESLGRDVDPKDYDFASDRGEIPRLRLILAGKQRESELPESEQQEVRLSACCWVTDVS